MPIRVNTFLKALGLGACLSISGLGVASGEELKKVTYAIATADLNVGYPFATLPKALGYFEAEGLDVQIVAGQSSAATAQLLLTGRADVGVAQPDPVMVQRANLKIPLVSFYAICRRGTNRFVVNPDSPIQSAKDFKGKKIGVADLGSGGVTYLRARLKEAGLDMNDVQLIATGYGTPSFEAQKNGTVDVSVSFTGGIVRQQLAGYPVRMLPATEAEQQQYSYNLFASQSYIDKNPDVIAKIGRATAKATIFLKNNPEAAVRLFWKQYPDRAPKNPDDTKALANDLAILNAQVRDMAADELPDNFPWGSQEASVYQKIQDYLVDAGQIKAAVDPATFYTSRFEKEFLAFDSAPILAEARKAK